MFKTLIRGIAVVTTGYAFYKALQRFAKTEKGAELAGKVKEYVDEAKTSVEGVIDEYRNKD